MTRDIYRSHRATPTASAACIFSAASFPAICFADDALTWPVNQLCRDLNSPVCGLRSLLDAAVTDIAVYHRPGGPVTHDYLIACINLTDSSVSGGQSRIWVRCERNPGAIPGGIAKLYRDAAPAVDTVKFSNVRQKLTWESDVAIMMCAYDALRFEHLVQLLGIIHAESPQYGLASYNCWWFAAVVIQSLEIAGCDWIIRPSKDWAKRAIQALGKSTEATSKQVTQQFGAKWCARLSDASISTIQRQHVPNSAISTNRAEFSDASNVKMRNPPMSRPIIADQFEHVPHSTALCGPPPYVSLQSVPPCNPDHSLLRDSKSACSMGGTTTSSGPGNCTQVNAVPAHRELPPRPIPQYSPLRLQHAIYKTTRVEPMVGTKAYEYSFYPPFASNGSILSRSAHKMDGKPPSYSFCVNEPLRKLSVDTLVLRDCLPPSYYSLVSPSLSPPSESQDNKLSRLPPCGPAVTRTASFGKRPLPEIPLNAGQEQLNTYTAAPPDSFTTPPPYELHSLECPPLVPDKQGLQRPGPSECFPRSECFIPYKSMPLQSGANDVPPYEMNHGSTAPCVDEAIYVMDANERHSDGGDLESTGEFDSMAYDIPRSMFQSTKPDIPTAEIGATYDHGTAVGQIDSLQYTPSAIAGKHAERIGDIQEVLQRVTELQAIIVRQAGEIKRLAHAVAIQHQFQHEKAAAESLCQPPPATANKKRPKAAGLARKPQHMIYCAYEGPTSSHVLPTIDAKTKRGRPRITVSKAPHVSLGVLHDVSAAPSPPASRGDYKRRSWHYVHDIVPSTTVLSAGPRLVDPISSFNYEIS